MTCPKCGGTNIQHLIFMLRCVDCSKAGLVAESIFPLPKGDTTGVDFLVKRYTEPSDGNAPGRDVEFTPLDVNMKG